MITYLGNSCSFGLPRVPTVNCRQFMYLVIFPFGFEGRMWDQVVSVPDHCLSFYFILFFHDFIYVYSPGAGADNPLGTKFLCHQKRLVNLVICCKFQKHLFEAWFCTIYSWFLHVFSPGQEQTAPRGQSLMSTEMSCHFIHLLQV